MTVELREETEQYLQDYLLQEGLKPEAASDVINNALKDFLFREMVRNAQERNKNLDVADTEALIEQTIREDRAKQRMQRSH